LESQNSQLEDQLSDLKTKLTKEVEDLKKANETSQAELIAEIGTLEVDQDYNQTKIGELSAQIDTLTQKLKETSDNHEDMKGKAAGLQSELTQAKEASQNLDEKVKN